ncbi:MAG TPA: hypothetical protein VL492_05290, partial [Methylovirgula sp.]|nr:hypothetical protein [Methylovirgula sp.]
MKRGFPCAFVKQLSFIVPRGPALCRNVLHRDVMKMIDRWPNAVSGQSFRGEYAHPGRAAGLSPHAGGK